MGEETRIVIYAHRRGVAAALWVRAVVYDGPEPMVAFTLAASVESNADLKATALVDGVSCPVDYVRELAWRDARDSDWAKWADLP